MRGPFTALLLAAPLALTACSVDVEGAACAAAGSTQYCPDGQACGTDLTCSKAAAACAAGAPCSAGALACRSGSNDVMACTAAGDPACGTWVVETACVAGVTTCGVPASGPPGCRCAQVVVDPANAGQACRYAAIATAVAYSQSWSIGTVLLGGAAGQVYGTNSADAAPIVIPAGMTVAGADTPYAPAGRTVAVQGTGASEGIRIEAGGTLAGVTVVRGAATAPALAVRVAGASPAGGNSLESFQVTAGGTGGAFSTGVRIEGSGAVAISAANVVGATTVGIDVARASVADLTSINSATLDTNGIGVRILTGDVTLAGPLVRNSAGDGVVAGAAATNTVRLTLQDGVLLRNGGGGLSVSLAERLHLERTRICANTGAIRNVMGTNTLVGGLLAVGDSPPDLLVKGNLIHDNGGDQVLIGASGAVAWNLEGSDCTASERNVFAGYVSPGVGLAAVASQVLAKLNSWKTSSLPHSPTDFIVSSGGSIDAVGTGLEFCAAADAATLTCPP